jgi:hypothetical protein
MEAIASFSFHSYLIILGAAICALALLVYALPLRRIEVPIVLGASVGALLLGAGLGISAMAAFGYHWERYAGFNMGVELNPEGPNANAGTSDASTRMMGAIMKAGGMSRGADGGGLDPKVLLAALVLKLNLLEPQDLAGALTAEQKPVVARQLAELAELPELSPEEAQRRLGVLLDALESQKHALVASGFPWPARRARGSTMPAELANPFRDKENARQLHTVQGRLLVP